jgi:hypothetical protein
MTNPAQVIAHTQKQILRAQRRIWLPQNVSGSRPAMLSSPPLRAGAQNDTRLAPTDPTATEA